MHLILLLKSRVFYHAELGVRTEGIHILIRSLLYGKIKTMINLKIFSDYI